MPDIVSQIEQQVRLNPRFPKEAIDSWVQAIRADLTWEEEPVTEPVTEPVQMKHWRTRSGDWDMHLFAYPMADREGKITDHIGHTCTMASARFGIVFASLPEDSSDWAKLADWLYERMQQREFLGSAKLPSRSEIEKMIAKHALSVGNLDLRQPEQLKAAVNWTRDLISRLNDPGNWGIPRNGSEFRIWRSEKRVRVIQGPMIMPVRICFYALGYTIENDEVTPHDDMMCHLWASLYEP